MTSFLARVMLQLPRPYGLAAAFTEVSRFEKSRWVIQVNMRNLWGYRND